MSPGIGHLLTFDKGDDAPEKPTIGFPKGASRLEDTKAAQKQELIDDKAFHREVWTRDKKHCRCCGRKVIKTISRVPERGDVHHIHGRLGDLRFEPRAACLLCAECHEKVTGAVAIKLVIVPATAKGYWSYPGKTEHYIDARKRLNFERVA